VALDYIPLTALAGRPATTGELRLLAHTRMRELGYAFVGTEVGIIEYGAPAFERMLRARKWGMTILREDCLRATRPSLRLRDHVPDGEWIAILEAIAFAGRSEPPETTFASGGGI
jgi:hypothetical protein